MKTARFKITVNRRTVTGTVEELPEDKIKVTIDHPTSHSLATRYQTKSEAVNYARAYFEKGHDNPVVFNMKETTQHEGLGDLITILKNETKSLRAQYIDLCKKYAQEEFVRLMERAEWNEAEWCKYFKLTPRLSNPGTKMQFESFPAGFYNSRNARTYDRMQGEIRQAKRKGEAEWISDAEKDAIQHYENSIIKLANRILAKGLIVNQLKVKTSHVGVNIETVLTDGIKTVKAWTIIASGPIQQPHYRYLVK